MATKKTATTKPEAKAEPGRREHPAGDRQDTSVRARPYTGCGDPRSWKQRRERR